MTSRVAPDLAGCPPRRGSAAPNTPPPSDPFNRAFSEWLRLSMRAVPAFLIAAVLWLPLVVAVPLVALYLFSTLAG